jgi:chromosome segregation ATPase
MHPTTHKASMPSESEGHPTRQLFVDHAETQLAAWRKRLERLGTDATLLAADSKAIIQARMVELRAKLGAAQEQLEAVKDAANEYWDEARAQLELTWDEIKEIFDRTDPPRAVNAERMRPKH